MPTTPPRLQYLQKAVYAALVLTDDALDCVRQQRYAAGQNIGDVLQRKNSDADGGESGAGTSCDCGPLKARRVKDRFLLARDSDASR
jgi:hypothetical protein